VAGVDPRRPPVRLQNLGESGLRDASRDVLPIRTTIAGMSEVPVRELNQNTSGVLARVKRGEQIEITERGVVVARLVPAQGNPLTDMISAGRLRPATVSGPAPRPLGPVKTDNEAGELLRELRDAERY
jgi:prevent-host-death family protein